MEKNTSIAEFNSRVNSLLDSIRRRIYEDTKLPMTSIHVRVLVYCNGVVVDLNRDDIVSLIITDEKPTIYQVISNSRGWYGTNTSRPINNTRVTFNVKEVVTKPKNSFEHFVRREFNHYEDYLDFVTKTYQKCNPDYKGTVSIWTNTKCGDIGIPTILRNMLQSIFTEMTFTNSVFMTLKQYRDLPEEVKLKVDELVSPVVIDSDSVEVRPTPGYLNVTLAQGVAENYFITHNFDELVSEAFGDVANQSE